MPLQPRAAASATPTPLPFLVKATGKFDGNDGQWSTFDLKIGNPDQEFRVLVSTSGEVSWVPLAEGCVATSDTGPLPSNCSDTRGVDPSGASSTLLGYNASLSKASDPQTLGTYQLQLNPDLDIDNFGTAYNISATYYQDSFQLASGVSSSDGSSLQLTQSDTVFAGVADANLWVGTIGLGLGDVTDLSGGNETSFMQSLVDGAHIPSRSWGYTAGAAYKSNGGYSGNLVLGGYDQSRFDSTHSASFTMPQSNQQSLLRVNLKSLEIGSWSPPLDTFPAEVILDSTLPYMYLPDNMCDALAQQLGLQYDNITDLFLVNDTQRATNQNIGSITIILQDISDMSTQTSISFPYAAFDLTASFPIYTDGPRSYFPLRRSVNGQNTLGRVFFQEAYVIANYEQRNFTVAKTTFPSQAPAPQITPIYSSRFPSPTPTPPSHHGISGGAIAGIVIGAVAAVLLAVGAWFLFARRRKAKGKADYEKQQFEDEEAERRRRQTMISTVGTEDGTMVSYEMDTIPQRAESGAGRPGHHRQISELSSDTDTSRGGGRKTRMSEIFELEGGAPDTMALQRNEQRVNEPPPSTQRTNSDHIVSPTTPLSGAP
ncbi:acid protease [Rhizodiscina lignyota]|uniref:Acid protease n=1 Tax=Rhizodiscina lignyota TaxID=1504668 RepID=A0A9P4M4C5_9PEZI|nr:acid protease [Rhizodiscina lignyota]